MMGYNNIPFSGPQSIFKPFISSAVFPTSDDIRNALPNNIVGDALSIFVNFAIGLIKAVVGFLNLLIIAAKFILIFVSALTLTFSDVNFFLARILNAFQLISIVMIAHYARGTK